MTASVHREDYQSNQTHYLYRYFFRLSILGNLGVFGIIYIFCYYLTLSAVEQGTDSTPINHINQSIDCLTDRCFISKEVIFHFSYYIWLRSWQIVTTKLVSSKFFLRYIVIFSAESELFVCA